MIKTRSVIVKSIKNEPLLMATMILITKTVLITKILLK